MMTTTYKLLPFCFCLPVAVATATVDADDSDDDDDNNDNCFFFFQTKSFSAKITSLTFKRTIKLLINNIDYDTDMIV